METELQQVRDFYEKNQRPLNLRLCFRKDFVALVAAQAKALSDILEKRIPLDENPQLIHAHLILGEAAEILEAMGKGDELAFLDGLADMLYVTLGAAVQYDLPIIDAFAEVHRSNMTKNSHWGWIRRWKGPDYSPPNLRAVLQEKRHGNVRQR